MLDIHVILIELDNFGFIKRAKRDFFALGKDKT